jgi:hypothetical protein
MAIPRTQIDRVKLTEAERRFGRANCDRNEAPGIAAFSCLVLHPGGFQRCLRPQDDDNIGILERLVDLLGEARPAVEVPVPPDIVPGLNHALRELPGSIDIVPSIADKDPRQGSSGLNVGASALIGPKAQAR